MWPGMLKEIALHDLSIGLDISVDTISRKRPSDARLFLSVWTYGCLRREGDASFEMVRTRLLPWSSKLDNFPSNVCALFWALPPRSLITTEHRLIIPHWGWTLERSLMLVPGALKQKRRSPSNLGWKFRVCGENLGRVMKSDYLVVIVIAKMRYCIQSVWCSSEAESSGDYYEVNDDSSWRGAIQRSAQVRMSTNDKYANPKTTE